MSDTRTHTPVEDERQQSAQILFAVPEIDEDDVLAVADVLRSGWITTGEQCLALEADLGAYLGVDHVVAMSSCTAALETAIAYLGLAPGSRIGVPTWTFVSSALAAVHNGLRPVLLDIDPDTLNLSTQSLQAALSDGLDAIVGVHFAGNPLDVAIHEIAEAAGVPLVEDAAHALGAVDHRGRLAGQGTAGACFSFYATKNLTSGEGGAIATDDAELDGFARSYRLHGLSRDAWARYHPGAPSGYDLEAPGIKGNLSDVLAALARSQFRHFEDMQATRRALVTRYRENLCDIEGLAMVPGEMNANGADHLMVVLLPNGVERQVVVDTMSEAQISTSVHFQPLHSFKWFATNADIGPAGLGVADALAPRALSLPLHPGLSITDVDRVSTVLSAALGS